MRSGKVEREASRKEGHARAESAPFRTETKTESVPLLIDCDGIRRETSRGSRRGVYQLLATPLRCFYCVSSPSVELAQFFFFLTRRVEEEMSETLLV